MRGTAMDNGALAGDDRPSSRELERHGLYVPKPAPIGRVMDRIGLATERLPLVILAGDYPGEFFVGFGRTVIGDFQLPKLFCYLGHFYEATHQTRQQILVKSASYHNGQSVVPGYKRGRRYSMGARV